MYAKKYYFVLFNLILMKFGPNSEKKMIIFWRPYVLFSIVQYKSIPDSFSPTNFLLLPVGPSRAHVYAFIIHLRFLKHHKGNLELAHALTLSFVVFPS